MRSPAKFNPATLCDNTQSQPARAYLWGPWSNIPNICSEVGARNKYFPQMGPLFRYRRRVCVCQGQNALISRRALHPCILTTISHFSYNTHDGKYPIQQPSDQTATLHNERSLHQPKYRLSPSTTVRRYRSPTTSSHNNPLVEALGPEILGIVHGFDFSEVSPPCLYIQRPNSTPCLYIQRPNSTPPHLTI